MRTGHLFAGAGGGIYADLILGHRPIFAVEWDNYAANVLRERIKDGWFEGMQLHHTDVTLFDPSEYKGRVDSLHAGFPCQDISVAGNGAGIEGSRSGFWSEVVRVARELGPSEVFLENSPAITGRGLGTVLGDLADLGFDARWCVLPASAVGAPHVRTRWWCLARIPDTNSQRGRETEITRGECEDTAQSRDDGEQKHVADPKRVRWDEVEQPVAQRANRKETTSPTKHCGGSARWPWWSTEPVLGRVAYGVANRSNRIKCLGNGQVPLQAAFAYQLLNKMYKED